MANDKQPSVSDILKLKDPKATAADTIDRVFQATPVGALSTAIGDSFYGINHRQTPGVIPINKDYYGLTFFTRPRMNLTSANIRENHVRVLAPLLNNEPASIQRIIRCLLDPELAFGDGFKGRPITSPFVDRQQAFIPILTNNLLSMSGWPDVVAPIHTSEEGMYKEAFSFVDGITQNYSTYDISANFRNLPGDPITLLFLIWAHYASLVYQGAIVPYPDMIINNEIDYNTRIYRLVLDSSKTMVQKIAACGAAFPTNAPIGAAFNFEADRPINGSNDQISVHFQCIGAMYQDDILVEEFNQTVALFNDGMAKKKFIASSKQSTRGTVWTWTNQYYKKVPMDALGIFNNRGYPRIDPYTYELQWWVSNEDYQYLLPAYTEQQTLKAKNG